MILQYPIQSADDAASLARRVVAALGEPCVIDHHQVMIGASIGISVAPADAEDADHMLKNADMALYRTKSEGRGHGASSKSTWTSRRRRAAISKSICAARC